MHCWQIWIGSATRVANCLLIYGHFVKMFLYALRMCSFWSQQICNHLSSWHDVHSPVSCYSNIFPVCHLHHWREGGLLLLQLLYLFLHPFMPTQCGYQSSFFFFTQWTVHYSVYQNTYKVKNVKKTHIKLHVKIEIISPWNMFLMCPKSVHSAMNLLL